MKIIIVTINCSRNTHVSVHSILIFESAAAVGVNEQLPSFVTSFEFNHLNPKICCFGQLLVSKVHISHTIIEMLYHAIR